MSEAQSWQKMGEILEVLYILPALILVYFFGPNLLAWYINSIRFHMAHYTLAEMLTLLTMALIGTVQLFAIWLAKKKKPWSITVMVLLSSLAIPVLLLSIPVLGPEASFFILPMYLICLLNIVNLGLLSQDSITSKLLNRPQINENDGPVLVLVVMHAVIGPLLVILIQFELLPRAADLTILSVGLMNAVLSIGVLFVLLSVVLIIRLRYAWLIFLVLDVIMLTISLSSLVIAFQIPNQLVVPTAYYGSWTLGDIIGIAFAGMTCAIMLVSAVIYSIPALDTGKTLISLNKEHHEE